MPERNLRWQFARFDDLPIRDWYAVSKLRIDVFVMEQNCPFQDNDGADFFSWHLLGWHVEGDTTALAAYCRLVDPGIKYPEPSIGRVVTAQTFRRHGYGKVLLREALLRHDALYQGHINKIGAQQRLEKFYNGFGFVTSSEMYIEDGIPHVEMVRGADAMTQLPTVS